MRDMEWDLAVESDLGSIGRSMVVSVLVFELFRCLQDI